ncbi:MAG: hypothetical protein WC505_07675 [Patescibacteria group bacterium]
MGNDTLAQFWEKMPPEQYQLARWLVKRGVVQDLCLLDPHWSGLVLEAALDNTGAKTRDLLYRVVLGMENLTAVLVDDQQKATALRLVDMGWLQYSESQDCWVIPASLREFLEPRAILAIGPQ